MKISTPRIFDWLAVAAIVAAVLLVWFGAGEAPAEAPEVSSAVRVEIQRYIGYEILPVRYLSLPYDLTMNTNEQVALLDVGALLLIFVPIVMLLGLRRQPWLQGVVMLLCLFLLVISTANGFIYNPDLEMIRSEKEALTSFLANTSFADAPAGVFSAFFYQLFLKMYGGIYDLLQMVSGNRDAVTYPLLLALFALFFYISNKRMKDRKPVEQALLNLVFAYTFFWLILSSGIVWYGFLAFPLFTVLIFWSLTKQQEGGDMLQKTARYGFYLLVAATVLTGFTQRISNIKIDIVHNDPLIGKRFYDPAFVKYQAGDIDESKVIEAFYPSLTKAVEEINRETNSLIYNVGTRFSFFIRENDERIFSDNQLDLFDQIKTKYPSKEQITNMLRASGFKYVMIDFNTVTSDKTPEKILVERFKNLMLLFYENPGVDLLATDRVLKETIDGKEQYKYGVYGDAASPGNYAIFRIK